jgi:hypothetical protein
MVSLLIAFPQMSLIYKAGQPVIDVNKVKIEIPQESYGGGAGDIMKDLGGGSSQQSTPAEPEKKGGEESEGDELMKELKGGK